MDARLPAAFVLCSEANCRTGIASGAHSRIVLFLNSCFGVLGSALGCRTHVDPDLTALPEWKRQEPASSARLKDEQFELNSRDKRGVLLHYLRLVSDVLLYLIVLAAVLAGAIAGALWYWG